MSNELEEAFKQGFREEVNMEKVSQMDYADWGALIGTGAGFLEPTPFGEMFGAGLGYTVGSGLDLVGSLFGGGGRNQQSQTFGEKTKGFDFDKFTESNQLGSGGFGSSDFNDLNF